MQIVMQNAPFDYYVILKICIAIVQYFIFVWLDCNSNVFKKSENNYFLIFHIFLQTDQTILGRGDGDGIKRQWNSNNFLMFALSPSSGEDRYCMNTTKDIDKILFFH